MIPKGTTKFCFLSRRDCFLRFGTSSKTVLVCLRDKVVCCRRLSLWLSLGSLPRVRLGAAQEVLFHNSSNSLTPHRARWRFWRTTVRCTPQWQSCFSIERAACPMASLLRQDYLARNWQGLAVGGKESATRALVNPVGLGFWLCFGWHSLGNLIIEIRLQLFSLLFLCWEKRRREGWTVMQKSWSGYGPYINT